MHFCSKLLRFQSTLPVWGATNPSNAKACFSTISIHAPRVGSDFAHVFSSIFVMYFNPRSPCGERRITSRTGLTGRYFNPRSPCGERLRFLPPSVQRRTFQSTLPVWGATQILPFLFLLSKFQSTLPVWGATSRYPEGCRGIEISIHAPRVGSDSCAVEKPKPHCDFNPRSPCGERRCATSYNSMTMIFQSTLPVWGATWPCAIQRSWARFQSTLPVWGATCFRKRPRRCYTISIHAPRVGSDLFQQPHGVNLAISIHAPRVGSDPAPSRLTSWAMPYFNPRSPCGERPARAPKAALLSKFQSTLPVWGATATGRSSVTEDQFQSTLPVWGATWPVVCNSVG